MNPYSGVSFFEFFGVLFTRIFQGNGPLAFDEVQCLVLLFLSLALAFIGPFLVARKMTMLANSLSHTVLLGIVSAFILMRFFFGGEVAGKSLTSFSILFPAALISAFCTSFCTEFLTRKLKVQEDASIGVVFTTLFALGVLLVTLFTKNIHLGIEAIMGNIDALHMDDVKISAVFSLGVVFFYTLFFRGFFTLAFDSSYAKSIGFPVKILGYLLMLFTAGAAVTAFRAVGVILFLAYLVGPVLIARLYTKSFRKLIVLSFLVSGISSLFSVAFSRHLLSVYTLPLSTSALAVTAIFVFYLLSVLFKSIRYKKTS